MAIGAWSIEYSRVKRDSDLGDDLASDTVSAFDDAVGASTEESASVQTVAETSAAALVPARTPCSLNLAASSCCSFGLSLILIVALDWRQSQRRNMSGAESYSNQWSCRVESLGKQLRRKRERTYRVEHGDRSFLPMLAMSITACRERAFWETAIFSDPDVVSAGFRMDLPQSMTSPRPLLPPPLDMNHAGEPLERQAFLCQDPLFSSTSPFRASGMMSTYS
jgi:hypothetical protein